VQGLPIIEGEGAPKAARGLFEELAKYDEFDLFQLRAIRVGERRWTVQLADGRQIMLPEKHYGQALASIMAGPKGQRLFDHNFITVDLRISDKIALRLRHRDRTTAIQNYSTHHRRAVRG